MAGGGAGRLGESQQQLDGQPEQPGGTRAPNLPLQVEHSLLSGFNPKTCDMTLRSLFSSSGPVPSFSSIPSTFQGTGSGGDAIRRALLRSSRGRTDVKVDDLFPLHKATGEMKRDDESQESTRNTDAVENNREVLLGYDAQWCWIESQDDVTFL